ncbi:MAG TPA: 50S ribosomal protein L11 methyltransferase [Candidatus Methylomirabilis sp.]|nr:50S ribosomal protein L11 methyltransferase [Candidatus Methylomirabilis sp.]
MTRWKSFSVQTRREAVDGITQFLVAHGSLGTAYDEQLLGAAGDPADPIPPPPEVTRLTAYFPWDTDLHALKQAFLDLLPVLSESFGPGPEAFSDATEITDTGWAEKWKEHFHARKIGRRIVIKPSWETVVAGEGEVVLTVDPGQAFGTGTHETTRMCLRMIEDVFDLSPAPREVLDVGTGTGILGIAAARLGATRVLAVDTDPVAVDVAGKNAEGNGVAAVFRADTTPLPAIPGTFDLVLGNLIAEILIDMAADLVLRTAPGGHLILSGILAEKSGWVIEEFGKNGASPVAETVDGPWAALLLRREA